MKRKPPMPGRGRGRPRTLPEGSEQLRVYVPIHAIDAWRAAGGTDLRADIARAFTDRYVPQK